jgi:hypothetical protein
MHMFLVNLCSGIEYAVFLRLILYVDADPDSVPRISNPDLILDFILER